MSRGVTLTFEEGCNKYLENCRQRNLREGTINHYRQSYLYLSVLSRILDIDVCYVLKLFALRIFRTLQKRKIKKDVKLGAGPLRTLRLI